MEWDRFIQEHEDTISVFSDILEYPTHLHDRLELFCIHTDDTHVRMNDEDYPLGCGDVACVFPFVTHQYVLARSDYEVRRSTGVITADSMLGDMKILTQQYLPRRPVVPAHLVHPEVYMAFERIREALSGHESFQVISAWTQLLFARLLPYLDLVPRKETKSNTAAQKAIAFIAQHYNEPLTLKSMAATLGFSTSYLSHVLIDKSGKSFSELLNFTRVDKVRHMLTSTDLDITQIAYEAGFSSIRSFNRCFFQICNMSPREYRRLSRKI